VRLLLDSHALLWFGWDSPQLSARGKAMISDPQNELWFSAGSMWEIAIKAGLGKINLDPSFDEFMEKAIVLLNLSILPISVAHAAMYKELPFHHRDPFDRLLIAQSKVENLPVLSADALFDEYFVMRVW
jgi:PIN domain nuclease of toxin-antitoxin system